MGQLAGGGMIAIEWSLIGIAFCLIIARLNLRLFHLKSGFSLSDAFTAVAFAAGIFQNAIDILLYLRGVYEPYIDWKLNDWVASEEESVYVYKMFYISWFPFYIQQYCNKGTLLALYYQIFSNGSTKTRIALACIVVYCSAGFITNMCMLLFLCKWGCFWSYTDYCSNRCGLITDNLGWAFHFSSEILVFVFPLVCISGLNMSKAQKISASITFGVGLINISVTLARWFVVQAVLTPEPPLNVGEAMAVADGHIGLIVSILPSLRPYLRSWQESKESRHFETNNSTSENRHKDGISSSQISSPTRTTSSKAEGTYHIQGSVLKPALPTTDTPHRPIGPNAAMLSQHHAFR
ncbi:hypothetical protein LZ30DRAFT_393926 [Colletotrichum cereale]|nr:hypothetical protein LZ30DRAFT_393926 [Colletotrichum cereale]